MTRLHKLTIEPMTKESFKPFGEVLDAGERPADHRIIRVGPLRG